MFLFASALPLTDSETVLKTSSQCLFRLSYSLIVSYVWLEQLFRKLPCPVILKIVPTFTDFSCIHTGIDTGENRPMTDIEQSFYSN
jgi:hypothetical protein